VLSTTSPAQSREEHKFQEGYHHFQEEDQTQGRDLSCHFAPWNPWNGEKMFGWWPQNNGIQ